MRRTTKYAIRKEGLMSNDERTHLLAPEIEQMLDSLKSIRKDKRDLGEADTLLGKSIRQLMQRFRDEYPGQAKFQVGEARVTFGDTMRSKLSVERLLELGVDPGVIEDATEWTTSEQMRLS